MNTTTNYAFKYALDNSIDNVGGRAVRVVQKIKSARGSTSKLGTLRSDVEEAAAALEVGDMSVGLARPWPMLAARLRKIAANDSLWVELDANGFRVDVASAKDF